jgi:hypothetical protein
MSFDVFFIALEPPRPTIELRTQVEGAVGSVGGRLLQRRTKGHIWEDIEAEGGATFEWYGPSPSKDSAAAKGGGMAALRGIDLPICRCLYAIAAETDWVIVAAMEESPTIRVKGSRELPLYEGMPALVVIDKPEELCTLLRGGYSAWTKYKDQVVIDSNQP